MLGLTGLTDVQGLWQAKNWDPAGMSMALGEIGTCLMSPVGSDGFQRFCDALLDGKAGSKIGLIRL